MHHLNIVISINDTPIPWDKCTIKQRYDIIDCPFSNLYISWCLMMATNPFSTSYIVNMTFSATSAIVEGISLGFWTHTLQLPEQTSNFVTPSPWSSCKVLEMKFNIENEGWRQGITLEMGAVDMPASNWVLSVSVTKVWGVWMWQLDQINFQKPIHVTIAHLMILSLPYSEYTYVWWQSNRYCSQCHQAWWHIFRHLAQWGVVLWTPWTSVSKEHHHPTLEEQFFSPTGLMLS
jgi:hypothetical protein